jgi:hypothetical protein
MAFRVSSGARHSGASGKRCRPHDGRPALLTLRSPALRFRSSQSFAVREPAVVREGPANHGEYGFPRCLQNCKAIGEKRCR